MKHYHCDRCGKEEKPLFAVSAYTRRYKIVCASCLLHITAAASVGERRKTHGQIMFDSYIEAGYYGIKSL